MLPELENLLTDMRIRIIRLDNVIGTMIETCAMQKVQKNYLKLNNLIDQFGNDRIEAYSE